MFKQKFANNLKYLRKSRKLTQEQLAELVGVDFRYISILETAKSFPSCDVIEKLASALNVDYYELFNFDYDLTREEQEKKLINLVKLLDNHKLYLLYKIAKDLI
mgnify:CR=1 FL=1